LTHNWSSALRLWQVYIVAVFGAFYNLWEQQRRMDHRRAHPRCASVGRMDRTRHSQLRHVDGSGPPAFYRHRRGSFSKQTRRVRSYLKRWCVCRTCFCQQLSGFEHIAALAFTAPLPSIYFAVANKCFTLKNDPTITNTCVGSTNLNNVHMFSSVRFLVSNLSQFVTGQRAWKETVALCLWLGLRSLGVFVTGCVIFSKLRRMRVL
jgi:hypothetical protein